MYSFNSCLLIRHAEDVNSGADCSVRTIYIYIYIYIRSDVHAQCVPLTADAQTHAQCRTESCQQPPLNRIFALILIDQILKKKKSYEQIDVKYQSVLGKCLNTAEYKL